MKNLMPFYLFLLLFSMIFLPGCDLFGDEEHCQNETIESRIWSSDQHNVYTPTDTAVSFVFNLDGNLFNRSFQIKNVCPFGAIGVKLRIIEKGSILSPQPLRYRALLVEVLKETGQNRVRKLVSFYRQSANELKTEIKHELIGLPEEGERTFFVGVAAVYAEGDFNNRQEMGNRTKAIVSQIEFIADFVKYN